MKNCPTCGAEIEPLMPVEPPIGTWVRDRHGALFTRHSSGGWGMIGFFPLGRWEAMWRARGPLVVVDPFEEES